MASAFRLSLAANFLLVGATAVLFWNNHISLASYVTTPAPEPAVARPELAPSVAEPLDLPATGTRIPPRAIAQLESLGVPRQTLINVVIEDLSRCNAQRVLALQKKYAPRQVPDREMRELVRDGDAEQIRELKATFGEEGYRAWDKEQTLRNLNRARVPGDELPMTDDEAERAYRLQKEFDEKSQELQFAMEDGVADRADVGALQAQAQATLDQELEKLLGPQRFNELRGNVDPTTEVFRTYGALNPTADQAKAALLAEEEFRANESALSKRLNDNPGSVGNIPAELQALNDAREENLRQIFGAAAYDNVKQQNDPTYQTLRQFAETWEIGGREIQSVYATVHTLETEVELLRNAAEVRESAGQRVNWREVNAAVEQVRRRAEASLQNQLGDRRLQRLKENGVLNSR